jgi:GT2 family glycosyltransferase
VVEGLMPAHFEVDDQLTISIVTYYPDFSEFKRTLKCLKAAIVFLHQKRLIDVQVVVVDNSVDDQIACNISQMLQVDLKDISQLICSPSNAGYGAGHNLATANRMSRWYLIMNADVELSEDALNAALIFLEDSGNHATGLISPSCVNGDGRRAYLCKRYPSVFDLALRGFAPSFMRKQFQKRLAHYEYRQVTEQRPVEPITIVSGCFMFFRGETWRATGGFSPCYFLYFEDFDLSMRLNQECKIAYVPSVRIMHHGGHAARKGLKHVLFFLRSACRFFTQHGWKLI